MLNQQPQPATNHLASQLLGHYCRLLKNLDLEQTVNVTMLLKQLGLNPNSKHPEHCPLKISQYYQLLAYTASSLQQHDFFLRLGQSFDISDAGILGYASLSVDNLRQSWELTNRNYALFPHPISAQRLVLNKTVSLRLNSPSKLLGDSRYLQEDWLSATWKWMCQRLPELARQKGLSLKLNYPAPNYADQYTAIFPGSIQFNQVHTELSFPESWYDIPFATANPATAALCQQQCLLIMNQLQNQTALVEKVQRLLLLSPQRKFPSLKETAQYFQMSSHSFHRQLKKDGLTFRDLVNEVKMELAKDYLKKTKLPLQEISFLLGYQHSANFYRAFNKHLGITAGQYRQKNQTD